MYMKERDSFRIIREMTYSSEVIKQSQNSTSAPSRGHAGTTINFLKFSYFITNWLLPYYEFY